MVTNDVSRDAGADTSIAEAMAALARRLSNIEGLEPLLDTVVHAAVASVPGAEYAGISELRARRILEPRVYTNDVVRQINELQTELSQGPCLDAIYGDSDVVRTDDLEHEARWPKYVQAVRSLGILSGISFRLAGGRQTVGSLSLFSTKPDAFDRETEVMGALFATHAGIALRNAANDYDFNEALRNRDVIGQAKGVLIERFKIDEQRAFAMLVEFSQREHLKLRDVAIGLMQDAQSRPGD